ncbi:MAG: hypothetical protein KME26_17620 [Oscillatoria princeps RMCB-10]|nr:hypothetical protein [Oscillatoria princeps RMCB-10]
MTAVALKNRQSIQYPPRTVARAERAMRCAPFGLELYAAMQRQSVPLASMAGSEGVRHQYTKAPVPELAAENALLWLIQVGVLRREVDGQGITDSFRLTPLGRMLADKWQSAVGSLPTPSWRDRLYNAVSRWLRLPF